ncbi:hypothetical protein T07_3584 [Trichinella nelsoni]|uniref:Uncharacterized protein n=1 Tax=Trichinella nelsoni TaxID=6336 RepID=A0A0V0RMI9_9BILA|nr:hypothetical protein T07_3579 [Trichinella nelsoni]KRX19093.1 hypothetical protein T07_3584 [Trichinella nelsoni]
MVSYYDFNTDSEIPTAHLCSDYRVVSEEMAFNVGTFLALTLQELDCFPKLNLLSFNITECHVCDRLLCWSPQEKMLQTHKYQTNITITGTYIRQPFTISYMLKFICMLKASKQIRNNHVIEREGCVRNAYLSLKEEKRQHKIYSNT